MAKKKITVPDFLAAKENDRHFVMMTCYDYTIASLVEQSPIEMILVGDSVGNMVYGYNGTVPVTMDEMVFAVKAVTKGAPTTFVVGDLPFGSYNQSCEQAIANATRLMKEGGCDCVKLEGGAEMADKIAAIVRAGIPVMGHIGLTPQTASAMGGMKVQGKNSAVADKLVEDIKAIEAAGAFCCVVECVPKVVGEAMCDAVNIPVLSGGPCKKALGQGQNFYDMLGFAGKFVPKFARHYAELQQVILGAMSNFHQDCMTGVYPADENCYDIEVPGYSK